MGKPAGPQAVFTVTAVRSRCGTRPEPLLVDVQFGREGGCESPSPISEVHRWREKVPVRRTFIDFGSDLGGGGGHDAARGAVTERRRSPTPVLLVPRAGSRKAGEAHVLPRVLYRLSPTSAKAAGIWPSSGAATPSAPSTPRSPGAAAAGSGGGSAGRGLGRACSPRAGDWSAAPGVKCRAAMAARCCAAAATPAAATDGPASSDSESSEEEEEEEEPGRRVECPVYHEGAELPSRGSAAHAGASCKRCCFFPKGRCNNGFDCSFCHFEHERRKPKHKKNKKPRKKAQRKEREPSGGAPGLSPGASPIASSAAAAAAAPAQPPEQAEHCPLDFQWHWALPPGVTLPGLHEQQGLNFAHVAMPAQVMALPVPHASLAFMQMPYMPF